MHVNFESFFCLSTSSIIGTGPNLNPGTKNGSTSTEGHGAYLRYTDDFLLFGDDATRLWQLRTGIVERLAALRLRLAEPKSRLLATREGVPFCGFRFLPGLRPRVLGATKRRFEHRRHVLSRARRCRELSETVFAWYQFSREGNSEGLRRRYRAGVRVGGPAPWGFPRSPGDGPRGERS
ncbi:MAG: hypothetical protein KF791_11195 [Verrucomicrobiae bacterium]|nr:hypothetical protein [Verrucomicrobiae bacterium]